MYVYANAHGIRMHMHIHTCAHTMHMHIHTCAHTAAPASTRVRGCTQPHEQSCGACLERFFEPLTAAACGRTRPPLVQPGKKLLGTVPEAHYDALFSAARPRTRAVDAAHAAHQDRGPAVTRRAPLRGPACRLAHRHAATCASIVAEPTTQCKIARPRDHARRHLRRQIAPLRPGDPRSPGFPPCAHGLCRLWARPRVLARRHFLVFGGFAFLPVSLGPAGDCPCKD